MRWNGKKKAVTFSFDDGVISDRRLIETLNRHNLKATFNLNSGLLGTSHSWVCGNFEVKRLPIDDIQDLYRGHEIAVHGKKHLNPTELTDAELEEEMLEDKQALEALFGTQMVGMAYSFGAYDDRIVQYLKKIGLQYGRTVQATHSFDLQVNLLTFHPTCHHKDAAIFTLIDRFFHSPTDKPQLLYIWGHAYEFDADENWDHLERLCSLISGHEDVFYGTNKEVLL